MAGPAFPALTATVQRFHEGDSDAGKEMRIAYDYNAIGNVVTYIDFGNDETSDDGLEASIGYFSNEDNYLLGAPDNIVVKNGETVLRKREATVDPATGNVTQIRQYLSEEAFAVYDLEYYPNGNLRKITRPKNAKGELIIQCTPIPQK